MSESKMRTRDLAEFALLTVEGAAARRGWAVPTVQRWIQTGLIPVVLVGSGRNRTVHLLAIGDVDAFTPPPRGRPPLMGRSPTRERTRKVKR